MTRSECHACGKALPLAKKTKLPRKFCGAQACMRELRRRKFAATSADGGGDICQRCESPIMDRVKGRAGDVCSHCSAIINRRIQRFLEDQPKPLPTGSVLELATELGISGYAATKRISRIRRGEVSP